MAYLNGNKILNVAVNGTVAEPIVVDQTYNPESENAQSGKAVAEAIGKNNAVMDNAINNGDTYTLNTAKAYTDEKIGDIETALDELHAYAQALVNGGASE